MDKIDIDNNDLIYNKTTHNNTHYNKSDDKNINYNKSDDKNINYNKSDDKNINYNKPDDKNIFITDSQNNYDTNFNEIDTDDSTDDSPWNYKILLLMRKIGKKTMGYRWMHEQEALYNESMDTKFGTYEMLILAFMGTITGAGFINFVVGSGINNNQYIYITITIIQLVTVFLSAIIKGFRNVNKYEKNKNDHFYSAHKNAELNLGIQYQLSLNLKDREVDKIFLKNAINNFNDILLLSPAIREITKQKYLEESNDNDIFNPIITDDNGSLKIIINDNNKEKQDSKTTTDSKLKYQIDRWLQHF